MTHPSRSANRLILLRRIPHAFLALMLGAASLLTHAQELNCNVTVIAPQISNVDASRFDALEDAIREFMNGRRWTEDNFDFEERIECTLQLPSTRRLDRPCSRAACKSRVHGRYSIPITTRR